MTSDEHIQKSIGGYPVVRSYSGEFTGDVRYVTSDGRHWEVMRSIPNTMPTGCVIHQVKEIGRP